ncbi:MAG TPA: anthranilate synthase component I [Acidimicrobiales bacterium]
MTIWPDRQTFRDQWVRHTVVPVWREVVADLETPVSVYQKLVDDGEGFLLESVEHAERWSRWSFVGCDPLATITLSGGTMTTTGDLPAGVPLDAGMLACLEALVEGHSVPDLPVGSPPLHSGVVGYLGYDVVREVERLPNVPPDDARLPDAAISVIGRIAAFDHWRQRIHLIDNVPVGDGDPDAAYDAVARRLDDWVAQLGRPLAYQPAEPPTDGEDLPDVRRTVTAEQFQSAVSVAKEHILAGDVFQVVLSQRFDLDLDADAFDVYRVLRQVNPSPYMYFLRLPDLEVVGSSPEPMVQVLGGRVISRPIAGTRWRGRTDEEDRRLAAELREHPKEVAEHIMLVDLARNDVGRVVAFGSEHVDELMTLERYSHVMHLTSEVSGQLADGRSAIDVLRATLPAGTVSGAPKVRAMEIIDDLEPTKRGPYAGVVGYIDFSGDLDTAIAIRTMLVHDGVASVQAGAGVVADSDPASEDLECANKARALLAAVPAARRMSAARRRTGPEGSA